MMCTHENTPSFKDKRRFKLPKSRIAPKKHKFLSLRRQFPPPPLRQSFADSSRSHKPIALMDNQEHENVAYFFSASDGGDADLTGLLDSASESNSSHATDDSSRIRHQDFSPYASRIKDREERAALVRNALRSKEREESCEEKWVCYSEVVEGKVKEEEVSSSVVDLWRSAEDPVPLSLKLDYEDVVKAWSGRGPLYVVNDSADATRVVPDITDDLFLSNNGVKGEGSVGWWAVPEMVEEDTDTINKETTRSQVMSVRLKMGIGGRREASLLRYKAKRQKRLFSKKIRYQVRKLNAEKRPRVKGRFVKRS